MDPFLVAQIWLSMFCHHFITTINAFYVVDGLNATVSAADVGPSALSGEDNGQWTTNTLDGADICQTTDYLFDVFDSHVGDSESDFQGGW